MKRLFPHMCGLGLRSAPSPEAVVPLVRLDGVHLGCIRGSEPNGPSVSPFDKGELRVRRVATDCVARRRLFRRRWPAGRAPVHVRDPLWSRIAELLRQVFRDLVLAVGGKRCRRGK